MKKLLGLGALLFFVHNSSFADMNILILDGEGPGGKVYAAGHVAMHFDRICPDGGPLRLRLCHRGEMGGVFNRYEKISHEKYDWIIQPYYYYLYGVAESDQIPLYVNRKTDSLLIDRAYEETHTDEVIKRNPDGTPGWGFWRKSFAQTALRGIYSFKLKTTEEDDLKIIKAINETPNESHFNLIFKNCAALPREIIKMVYPDLPADIESFGMKSPKGVATDIVKMMEEGDHGLLTIKRYSQLPSAIARSTETLYPAENLLKNPIWMIPAILFAPYAFVGAAIYYGIISPFSLPKQYHNFADEVLSNFTMEAISIQKEQEIYEDNLKHAEAIGDSREVLTWLSKLAETYARNKIIGNAKKAHQDLIFGTKEQWKEYSRYFEILIHKIQETPLLPKEVREILSSFKKSGDLSKRVYKVFDTRGEFSIDKSGNLQMQLKLLSGETLSGGITKSTLPFGNPTLGFLIFASKIDQNLAGKTRNRDTIDVMTSDWRLLQYSACQLSHCKN